MRPTLHTVALDGPGSLSTTAKPQCGDWTGLREAGVDVLASGRGG